MEPMETLSQTKALERAEKFSAELVERIKELDKSTQAQTPEGPKPLIPIERARSVFVPLYVEFLAEQYVITLD